MTPLNAAPCHGGKPTTNCYVEIKEMFLQETSVQPIFLWRPLFQLLYFMDYKIRIQGMIL